VRAGQWMYGCDGLLELRVCGQDSGGMVVMVCCR
jgi:hypothetical protein